MSDRHPGENPKQARRRRAAERALLRGSSPEDRFAGTDWELSPHALRRSKELGFSVDELLATALDPHQTYGSGTSDHPEHYRVHQRGDMAIVVDPEDKVIVTTLLRTQRDWVHGVDRRATA